MLFDLFGKQDEAGCCYCYRFPCSVVAATSGAEDACSALWAELRLKDTGVEPLEFIVAGAE